jgi:hypothetical protein
MSTACTIPPASIGTLRDYVGKHWRESPKIMPESQISNVFTIPDVQYLHYTAFKYRYVPCVVLPIFSQIIHKIKN